MRPVIDTGKADPSKEARDHALWLEDGQRGGERKIQALIDLTINTVDAGHILVEAYFASLSSPSRSLAIRRNSNLAPPAAALTEFEILWACSRIAP